MIHRTVQLVVVGHMTVQHSVPNVEYTGHYFQTGAVMDLTHGKLYSEKKYLLLVKL